MTEPDGGSPIPAATAHRDNVVDTIRAPVTAFWNVRKT
jgi:hypothetical protein